MQLFLDLCIDLALLGLKHGHPVRKLRLVHLEACRSQFKLVLDVLHCLLLLDFFGLLHLFNFVFVHVFLITWVLVRANSFDKLGLLAGQDFAAGVKQLQEIFGQLKRVVRAALQLLAVVVELLEVVQSDFLDLEFVLVVALVRQEEVLKAVILTAGTLLDQVVLKPGLLVDNLDRILRQRKQKRDGTIRNLDNCRQCLKQSFFTLVLVCNFLLFDNGLVLPLEDLVLG